jgi:hypothetical protein
VDLIFTGHDRCSRWQRRATTPNDNLETFCNCTRFQLRHLSAEGAAVIATSIPSTTAGRRAIAG